MTDDEKLMQQALEALDYEAERGNDDGYRQLRDALRERLAQPEQEPVAWMHPDGRIWTFGRGFDKSTFTIPLYTAPPQRKPLTDEMVKRMKENCTSMEMRGAFADGWLSAEAAHGIKGEA